MVTNVGTILEIQIKYQRYFLLQVYSSKFYSQYDLAQVFLITGGEGDHDDLFVFLSLLYISLVQTLVLMFLLLEH